MSTIRGLPIHSISPHFSYNPARRFPFGNCLCVLSLHRICRQWATFGGRRFSKVALWAHYLCDIVESPASLTAGLRAMTVHVANGILKCGGATAHDTKPATEEHLLSRQGCRRRSSWSYCWERWSGRGQELSIPVASRGGPTGRKSKRL